MRLRPTQFLLSAVLLAISFITDLSAQTTASGALTGVVTDQSHAVVLGANVELKDDSKGTTHATKTDQEGAYHFFFLAPAKYTLTVTNEGFRTASRAVDVLLGPPGTVNITLEIAKARSEITVTDEAPIIQAENGDVSATMNQTQISEVPNPGNDLTYIAQTTPGVVMNTDIQGDGASQSNFSILGMPASSYHYTMDGMNITDGVLKVIMGGPLGLALGQNQVQEATVVSTGYSGQYGDAAGGNISYSTKSGGNEFHGNAQYYWNGRILNANNWGNKAFGNPRPFSIANQWAGSFGGPLKRDKLFFFFDTEGLRLLIPQVFPVTIPSTEFEAATIANIDSKFGANSASDAFYKQIFDLYNATPGRNHAIPGGFSDPLGCTGFLGPKGLGTAVPCAIHFFRTHGRPSQDALSSGRVDWNISTNDRVFFRIQREPGHGSFYSDPISALFDGDYDVYLWQAQLIETHSLRSSGASQFMVAGSNHSFYWKGIHLAQAFAAFPTGLDFNAPGTFNSIGSNSTGAYGCDCTQYQVSEDIVKTSGNHRWGFGATFARAFRQHPPQKSLALGQLSPQTLNAFYQGGFDPATPTVDFTFLTQSFTSQPPVHLTSFDLDAYGQDEWHVRPNLTVTFALRAEHHSKSYCESGCFARATAPFESINHDPNRPYNQSILTNQKTGVENIDGILWSPRFSFAWQPFGVSHNGVLRGGVGVFYDPLFEVAESFYLNPPIFNVYTALRDNITPDETNSLFKDTAASNAAFMNGFFAGETLAQMQAIDPNFFPPALNTSERILHAPQYQKWSLEWQQAISTKTSASISYVGHHGIHETVQNPSANAFGFGSLPAGKCASPPVFPCSDSRFSQVTQYGTSATSNYNGMVVSFRHQFTHWGNGLVQVNYTYGHAFDEVSNGGIFSFTTGSSVYPQDPNNIRGAYGPAEYDVRHSLNANYVWEIPIKAALRGHGPNSLVDGWQVSGTLFARTGFPYTVFDNMESSNLRQNNYFGEIYAVPVGPLPAGSPCGRGAVATLPLHPCQPAQVLANGNPNPNALFVQAGCETGFNAGHLGASGACDGAEVSFAQQRYRFRGPRYFNTDLAIMKNTKIPGWENAALGIGFQFFNLFNHPNFGLPANFSSDPGFGQIFYLEQPPTGILGSSLGGDETPRMIQLKAQLRF